MRKIVHPKNDFNRAFKATEKLLEKLRRNEGKVVDSKNGKTMFPEVAESHEYDEEGKCIVRSVSLSFENQSISVYTLLYSEKSDIENGRLRSKNDYSRAIEAAENMAHAQ